MKSPSFFAKGKEGLPGIRIRTKPSEKRTVCAKGKEGLFYYFYCEVSV